MKGDLDPNTSAKEKINYAKQDQEIAGEIMGEDLNENAGLHRDDARTLYDIEGVVGTSEVLDLQRLEVEGLLVGLSSPVQQESKAG
jgi:hypothetical protein